MKYTFKDTTSLVFVLFGISLGFILLANPFYALVAISCIAAVCIAIVQPCLLIIGYFFYAPFTEYLRYLFPAEISIGGKIFILSGSGKEILFFLAMSSFLYRKFIFKTQYRNKNITYYLILLLLTWLFINIFRNDSPIDGLWGFRNYLYAFGFYFIGYYFIHDKKTVMRIIRAFLLSGVVLAVVALIQIFYDPNFLVSSELLIGIIHDFQESQRVTSLLSNPNVLGKILVIVVLFAYAIFLYSHSKVEKLFLVVLSLTSLVVIFYTLSRESLLALVIGMLILSIVSLKNRNYSNFLPLIIGPILILPFLPSYFYERLYTISLSGGASRIIMWKTILANISNHVVLGMGTGSIGSFGLNVIVLKGTAYAVTDNTYLRILVEAGIIGLLLLLILCFYVAKDILVSLTAADQDFPKAISLSALLIFSSLLITAFFSESLFSWLESYIFWLITGYIGGYISASSKTVNITQSESLL